MKTDKAISVHSRLVGKAAAVFVSAGSYAVAASAVLAEDPTVTIPNPTDIKDFKELLTVVLQWVLSMAGGVALLMLIWGGFTYISSTGDQKKADEGKRIVTWTIVGLVVILLSYSIITVVDEIFAR